MMINGDRADGVISSGSGSPATEGDLLQVKQELLKELADSNARSRRWELSMMVLQVILTSVLGLLVWRVQAGIDKKISDEGLRLSARLALTQDFYKDRLRVYSELHRACLQVKAAARQLRVSRDSRSVLTDNIAKLYESYSGNSLYLSSPLRQKLDALWMSAVECTRGQAPSQDLVRETVSLAEKVEAQMREDLFVDSMSELSQLLQAQENKAGS